MEREIIFRGKDIKTGKWVCGYYGQFHNRPLVDEPNIHQIFEPMEDASAFHSMIGGIWHTVDPETVGQYTGLCDKNGTKIFEGDIIKIRQSTDFYGKPITFKGVVFFNEDECGFTIGKNGMKGYCISSLASYIFKSSATEIIGNFYDNPELLEE